MSFTSSIIAPPSTGRTIRNEKLATVSLVSPENRPTDIVEPERLIPGMIPTAWVTPINNARQPSMSLSVFLTNLVENRIHPVTISIDEIKKGFRKRLSIVSFRVNPTIIAGIILSSIYRHNREFSFFTSRPSFNAAGVSDTKKSLKISINNFR